MNYNDSLIEIDFPFDHGQFLALHFTKNCYNLEPQDREKEIIQPKKMNPEKEKKKWVLIKVLFIVCIGLFFLVKFSKLSVVTKKGEQKPELKDIFGDDEELKTVKNMNYGTFV